MNGCQRYSTMGAFSILKRLTPQMRNIDYHENSELAYENDMAK